MRLLSIISYLMIFIPGSMILVPWILVLVFGPFDPGIYNKPLVVLADISLLGLIYFTWFRKSKLKVLLDILFFILLLAPFAAMLAQWPIATFKYPLFILPLCLFIVLYIASIVKSYFKQRQGSL